MIKCADCKHWLRRERSIGACCIILPRWVEARLPRVPDIHRASFEDDSCDLGQPNEKEET